MATSCHTIEGIYMLWYKIGNLIVQWIIRYDLGSQKYSENSAPFYEKKTEI